MSQVAYGQSTEMPDYFRSLRLMYRAINNPNDNEFYHSIQCDSEAFANTDAAVLRPFTRKESEQPQMNSDKALLGVLICLLNLPIADTNNKAYPLPSRNPSQSGVCSSAALILLMCTIAIARLALILSLNTRVRAMEARQYNGS